MSEDRVATNYFNEVGSKKQPTAAEERELFRELSTARETKVRLTKRIDATKRELKQQKLQGPARDMAEQRVAELHAACDKLTKRIAELKGRAAEGYVRFVIKTARRYTKDPQALRDLIGEGNDGLMVAVEQFNIHYGWRFLTYAVYWIEVRIQEFLNRDGVVHVPNHAKKASRKLRRQEEVEMTRGVRAHHSFEEPTHAGIDTELLASPPVDASHENSLVKHMIEAGLDVEHRLILINTFGLRETEPMDLDDLSDYFFALDGRVRTPDCVKALKDSAATTLRNHLVSRGVSSAAAFF